MGTSNEGQTLTQWFKQKGFFFKVLPHHVATFLEVDSLHLAIMYCGRVNQDTEELVTVPEFIGTACFQDSDEDNGYMHAHGIKNLARLDAVRRAVLAEKELLFEIILEPRGPFPDLFHQ